jgi:hypothetical protein
MPGSVAGAVVDGCAGIVVGIGVRVVVDSAGSDPAVVVVGAEVVVVGRVIGRVAGGTVTGVTDGSSMVNTLLSVKPEPSSTTSTFQVPAGAALTLRQAVPWPSTFGIVNGPYVTSGLASLSVT